MTGRAMSVQIMRAFSTLVRNQILSPGEASQMLKRYQGMDSLSTDDVLSDLCRLDIPEEKLGTFGYICAQLTSIDAQN